MYKNAKMRAPVKAVFPNPVGGGGGVPLEGVCKNVLFYVGSPNGLPSFSDHLRSIFLISTAVNIMTILLDCTTYTLSTNSNPAYTQALGQIQIIDPDFKS